MVVIRMQEKSRSIFVGCYLTWEKVTVVCPRGSMDEAIDWPAEECPNRGSQIKFLAACYNSTALFVFSFRSLCTAAKLVAASPVEF